jgi:hypothetical protein
MATQTIRSWATTGGTLTMKLYTVDSDTAVDSASATESTNRKGLYSAAFTDLAAGTYIVQLEDGSGSVKSFYWVKTSAATGSYQAYEIPEGFDVNIISSAINVGSVAASINNGNLEFTRGDDLDGFAITGLGDITGNTNVWFTIKESKQDADSAAWLQVDSATGLLYVMGSAATAGDGSISVSDASAGDIAITVAADQMALILRSTDKQEVKGYYDIQWKSATGKISTLASGIATINYDVTRATA